jgi:hypothetical protein
MMTGWLESLNRMKVKFFRMTLRQSSRACNGSLQDHPAPRKCKCKNQKSGQCWLV